MGLVRSDLEKEDDGVKISAKTKAKEILKRKFPILEWLPVYTTGLLLQDLLAGFTVGLTEIPQGIAYAVVAGLPTQYGLYSGCIGGFIYFIIGSCKVINIGPTAVMSLMVRNNVDALGPSGAILMCFLSGCFIFLAGLLRLGFVVNFFSFPVTAGFMTAAAIEIASSQIKTLMGVSGGSSDSFLGSWKTVVAHASETKQWDFILGCLTMVFLFIVKETSKRRGTLAYRKDWSKRKNYIGRFIHVFSLARNAIAIVVSTFIAYVLYQKGYTPFELIGEVKKGLPSFETPPFSITHNGTYYSFGEVLEVYGTSLGFTPLIAIVEHIAIAKAFSKGRSVDATQEFISLGVYNIFASFLQAMPITGSFTRTAVNNASGAKTTVSCVVTGFMVLFALAFLTTAFTYIPKASLAGVIIVAMFYLCEFEAFLILWRTKKLDLIPFVMTMVCCLLLSLEYGIFIGITTNIVFVLYASARPKIQIEDAVTPCGNVFLVTCKTGLYFAAADYVREKILETCCGDDTTVIINGKYMGNIDSTIAKSFHVLKEELEIRKQKLVFLNFKKSVRESIIAIDKSLSENFKEETLKQLLEVA